jgi:hypothetical protein
MLLNSKRNMMNNKNKLTKIAALILLSACQLYIGYAIGWARAQNQLNQELIDRGVKEYNNRTGYLQYVAMLGLYSNNIAETAPDVIPGADALLPVKNKTAKR